jgi:hypothetical protein
VIVEASEGEHGNIKASETTKRPLLAKYVNQYTARNSMDYFIHKALGDDDASTVTVRRAEERESIHPPRARRLTLKTCGFQA